LPALIGEALSHAPADCVISDVGSTKRSIVEAIADPRFVGGHPLAGAETRGIEHARSDMFVEAPWYLTPSTATTATTLTRVTEMVRAMGAEPTEIGPVEHDRLMATVSHLPHVLANVLVSQLAAAHGAAVAGPSFRDATRVAGSNTAVWSEIYMDNRDALGEAIDDAVARLTAVRAALAAGDREALVRWSEQAAADREAMGR